MRILIYSTNFAPEPTGIGKYSGEMAAWLADHGHEVRVVAAPPYYPDWRMDRQYAWPPFRREQWRGVDVWRAPLCVHPRGAARGALVAREVLAAPSGFRDRRGVRAGAAEGQAFTADRAAHGAFGSPAFRHRVDDLGTNDREAPHEGRCARTDSLFPELGGRLADKTWIREGILSRAAGHTGRCRGRSVFRHPGRQTGIDGDS